MERDFGQVIKSKRHRLNLTQEEFAEQACCATITIRRIEGNTLRPSVQLAEKLAEVLAIQPDEKGAFIELARSNTDSNILSEEAMGSNKTVQEQRRTNFLLLIIPLVLILFVIIVVRFVCSKPAVWSGDEQQGNGIG